MEEMGESRRHQGSEDRGADSRGDNWVSGGIKPGGCKNGGFRSGVGRDPFPAYQRGRTAGDGNKYVKIRKIY